MRPAGRFVAEVLTALEDVVDVGANLLEIDEIAHEMIRDRGAESCYIGLPPVVRGLPVREGHLHVGQRRRPARSPPRLRPRDGDLLSVDFAASVDGWVSDSALPSSSVRRARRTCA